jgi:hypothetical protein
MSFNFLTAVARGMQNSQVVERASLLRKLCVNLATAVKNVLAIKGM